MSERPKSEQPVPVDCKIADREFRIACPPDEVDALLASARYLDARIRELKRQGQVIGIDRLAILAALNITNEYLQASARSAGFVAEVDGRLDELSQRLPPAGNRDGASEK